MTGKETAIEINGLKYSYLASKRINETEAFLKEVLKGIDIKIYPGEKVSIIGPNGAGKSTLLLNMAGLLDFKYRKGSVKVCGIPLNDKNIYNVREKIGYVFQDPNDQLFSTSIFDDVSFGLINYLNKKKDARAKDLDYIREVVSGSLLKVNLTGVENEVPYFLSYGEKKLAALATVISYDPDIFILDEPSSNLDPANRENFIQLLKSMEKTIVIATHDIDMAYEFSDRTIIINDGAKVYDGSSQSALTDKEFMEKNKLRIPLELKGKYL